MVRKKFWLLIVLAIVSLQVTASQIYTPFPDKKQESVKAVLWADSVLETLSLEEKIGQLIMIRAHTDKSRAYKERVKNQIEQYDPGGVCFFQGGPLRQTHLTREYQSAANIPLLVAIDGEWGLGMRLDSTLSYPFQMTLGAIRDNYLINLMGQAIAKELRAIGVNMNFAPVLDVNNNPQNPVINFRSFGENPTEVFKKGIQYAHGMQSQKVIACGKHFPGHGDTDQDSHHTLPVIKTTEQEMRSVHMLPFRKAAQEGIGAIMAAHVHVPVLDDTRNKPASLSQKILKGILRDKYNFRGLIISDALEMAGASQGKSSGQVAIEALKAGTDILLLPASLKNTIDAVHQAVKTEEISTKAINDKCRRILVYKYWSGLNKQSGQQPTNDQITQIINRKQHKALIKKLHKKSITLLKNNKLLPLTDIHKKNIAVVTVGKKSAPDFAQAIDQYVPVDEYHISSYASMSQFNAMVEKLEEYDLVITGMLSSSLYPSSNYGFSQKSFDFTELVGQQTQNVLVLFGNPYALNALDKQCNSSAVMVAYQNNKYSRDAAVEALFSATNINGRLPVSINDLFTAGDGITVQKQRLEESSPYFMNIDKKYLKEIDSIVKDGMDNKAYPGCQVLIAKEGKVFYHKAFGHHTYNQIRPVSKNDLYDLASLTKVAATTLSVMQLNEKGLIDIDRRLKDYLPQLKNSNKADIVLREMMAHQARLHPWIPFYLHTLDDHKNPSKKIYSKQKDSLHSVQVANHLYIRPEYQDSMLKEIKKSRLRRYKKYKYSDLGFYLLNFIIRDLTGKSLAQYASETFYEPMGLRRTSYNPLDKFDKKQIVPTEDDKIFRKQLVHGYVHDPGAAMMGGISGHAGLFSTASDLAAIMQMLLNNGNYGGKKYLDSLTVAEFTERQFPLNDNRRGIGFDKPLPDGKKGGPTCPETSNKSFGHSGFTGTYAWADPKYDLVYVFLSNRVYPNASNRRLISMDIRTKIQKVIYEAIQNNES